MPRVALLAQDPSTKEWSIASPSGLCLARLRSATGLGRAGDCCGVTADRELGDTPLCAHHYERALDAAASALKAEDDAWHYCSHPTDALANEIVYYLRRANGDIKIGTTTAWRQRFGRLTLEHGPLQILATHGGDRDMEEALHREFRALRLGATEWFRPAKPLWDHIFDVRAQQAGQRLVPGTVSVDELRRLRRLRPRRLTVVA